MRYGMDEIIEELYQVALVLLHKGDEETALKIAAICGQLEKGE